MADIDDKSYLLYTTKYLTILIRWGLMNILVKLFCGVITSLLLASTSGAQTNADRSLVWAAIGVGAVAPTTGGEGITNVAQIVFEKNPHHAALRLVAMHDIDRPTNEIGELSALYGRIRTMRNYPFVLSTGISAVGFFDCPDDDDSCFTVGLPLVAEVSRNARFIGIGLQAFTNINPKALYAGGVLLIKLGKLR